MIHVDADVVKVLTSPSHHEVADLCDLVYTTGIDLNKVVDMLKEDCAHHAKPKWKRGHTTWNVPECEEGYECYFKIKGICSDTEVVLNLGILKVDVTKWSEPVRTLFASMVGALILHSLDDTASECNLTEEMHEWFKGAPSMSFVFVRNSKQITDIDCRFDPSCPYFMERKP